MAKESTLVGFPYDSRYSGGIYDRAINSPTFRKLILKYFTTGVFPNPSTNLQVIANSGLNVTVKAGYANVNGVFCELKEDITLNLDSTSTYSRIDRIVLRHDDSDSVRATKLMILKGTADNNPQPVSLTRNETVYDICLANVTVKTSGIITQAEISDTRLDNDVCGIVTGTIKNVDTTTLYNQIQSDLDQFKENEKQEWNRWFNAIKEELEQIDVGQLTQDIQQIKQNYVPKSDIVNNLTSGGTNKPLSAEQGKHLLTVLNEKTTEINNKLFRLVKIYNNTEVIHFSSASGFFDFLSKQNVIDKMGITPGQYDVNRLQFIAWNSDFTSNNFYITSTMVDPSSNILKFRFENGAGASTAGRVTYVLMLFSDDDEGAN